MNAKKVNVILPTYNGSLFIREMLQCLLNQTYDNIDIYIRDDGSTDNTLEIVNEVAQNNQTSKRIIIINDDQGNLRCPKSFYTILAQCEPADYYSFCDQDDIWLDTKIEWAVELLEKEDNNIPLLYYSSYDYQDTEGNFIRQAEIQSDVLPVERTLFYTAASGFTLVFNEASRRSFILDVDPGIELHDRYLLRAAACFGKAIYDPRITAHHIRHKDAVTAQDNTRFDILKSYLKEEVLGNRARETKDQIRYFHTIFDEKMSTEQHVLFELFTSNKRSPALWFKKVTFPGSLRVSLVGELTIRALFFIGKI